MSSPDLHAAARNGAVDDARHLIANGADINGLDNMSRTPLHIACWKGDSEMVQLLLRSKAVSSIKAKDNFTALHFAVQSGSLECCRLLLEQNKTLGNMRISKGNKTALHIAAAKGNVEIIKLLLESGVDPIALTNKKQTALDFASDDSVFQLIKAAVERKIESDRSKQTKKELSVAEDEVLQTKKRSAPSSSVLQHNEAMGAPTVPITTSIGPSTAEESSACSELKYTASSSISNSSSAGSSAGIIKLDLNKRKQKRPKIGSSVVISHLYEDGEEES